MKARAIVVAIALAGCGTDAETHSPGSLPPTPPFNTCAADPGSFVRQAFLALDGRRPKSQAEVDVYVDLYNAVVAKSGDPKDAVARAIMAEPEFAERWIEQTMDAMHVQRLDYQSEASCWDHALRTTSTAALATAVRDQAATGIGDGGAQWNMSDLATSAITLDDVTPLYRAQVFSMMDHPIPAANVDTVEAELARRADFGATFDAGYLHRDTVCLDCHNSQSSVTDSDDPATDRFWPVPGLPEGAVYGAFHTIDAAKAHTAFRVDSFVEAGTSRPWGWSTSCGRFNAGTVPSDPAAVSGKLASVTGVQTTAYNLDTALKHGFDLLRGQVPPIGMDGAIADPDTALAWLVTLKMTEDVWIQVAGTPLTIANYYPRNRASSELLNTLATRYTQSGYSLKALLSAIVASDYFNRQPAESGCGAGPYTYPNVYDPWVISDPDPAKHFNGPGDAVAALDARTLVTALASALDWETQPLASRFADYGDFGCETEATCAQLQQDCTGGFGQCCNAAAACAINGVLPYTEVPFERGVGMFMRNSERGFRGLDFQARLVWENHEAVCAKPAWMATPDFIDTLITAGASFSTTTAADLVAALKDRLIGEPTIDPGAETAALSAIVGDLSAPASTITAPVLRQVCGALVGTPQFLLSGIAGHGGTLPKLTPATAQYLAVCTEVAAHVPGATCTGTLALP
ncbi:MAG: hypothetical protein ABI591_24185 [Kofleriaceae bacterium]